LVLSPVLAVPAQPLAARMTSAAMAAAAVQAAARRIMFTGITVFI
jgi:hypothetical protein